MGVRTRRLTVMVALVATTGCTVLTGEPDVFVDDEVPSSPVDTIPEEPDSTISAGAAPADVSPCSDPDAPVCRVAEGEHPQRPESMLSE